jgi:iron(III) transport system permease protein
MTSPVVARRVELAELVGSTAAIAVLLALVALVAWPLADVLLTGLLTYPPPLAMIVDTLAVAVAAMLGALGLASVLAAATRVRAPGAALLVTICRAGVLVPPFIAPLALLVLAHRAGLLIEGVGVAPSRLALGAIAVAQAIAFAPHAFALVGRALARVPAEAEQAAELLGASRATVLRRVTLALARPGLVIAGLVVLGLCLSDVTAPLLLGNLQRPVLGARIVLGVHWLPTAAAGAVALSAMTIAVAIAGRTWHHVFAPLRFDTTTPSGVQPTRAARVVLSTVAWVIAAVFVAMWIVVPLAGLLAVSRGFVTGVRGPLLNTLGLGLGVALVGTVLALAVAWIAERRRGATTRAVMVLTRLPVAIPGVVGGVGYVLAFGIPQRDLVLATVLVAVWELPLMLRVAGNVLARSDRATEYAALTLGADALTTLRRVVLPALRPAAAWILCHGFAAGVATVGPVIVIAQIGNLNLAVIHMLASASTGSVGAACAVATVLLALAGGAMLLGRAAAGRESIPTLLA